MLEKYLALPDYMTTMELKEQFNKLMDYAGGTSNLSNKDVLDITECLIELADRQWHTYETLDEEIKSRIELWIGEIWDELSNELIDSLSCVIGRLGLVESYKLMKNALTKELSDDVRKTIEETVRELDDNIADPYSGLRQLKSNNF